MSKPIVFANMEGVWKAPGMCLEHVWRVAVGGLEGVWRVSGSWPIQLEFNLDKPYYYWGVRGCLECVWRMSAESLEGVRKVSG